MSGSDPCRTQARFGGLFPVELADDGSVSLLHTIRHGVLASVQSHSSRPLRNMHIRLPKLSELTGAHLLFWAVTLTLMLDDDVAMIACMFT